MTLTARQREALATNAERGFVATSLVDPDRRTLRLLSMETARTGTVRQTVGSGANALWSGEGHNIRDIDAAEETVRDHLQAQASRHNLITTYAAAQFDNNSRPEHTLIMPNQMFGSHTRGATESQDASAERGDHRGHGVSQAQTIFSPGLHRAIMTSQSPEMNTSVQLPWERHVNVLLANGRSVIWEVHNEFSAPTIPGMLPRASHQTYVISSVDAAGDDLRVHVNARISQR